MSSNPTQPKFGDQGEGVSFPPEDDAEGHRLLAAAGDQPEGFAARADGGDGRPEGFKAMADSEDDTEGHRVVTFADAPDQGPEGHKLIPLDGGDDDTEGHRIALVADGEDDTEGHRAVASADGGGTADGPEGARRF